MEQIQQTASQRGKQPRVSSSLRNHDVGRDIELLDPPEETEQRRDNVTDYSLLPSPHSSFPRQTISMCDSLN